jgi:hypothetical protein
MGIIVMILALSSLIFVKPTRVEHLSDIRHAEKGVQPQTL